MSEPDRHVQDLGISDEEVTRILDDLDDREMTVKRSMRRSVRHYLRGTALVVKMSRPGYVMFDYLVRLRNVSEHGVTFLSRHALERGNRLALQLPIGPDLARVEKQAIVRRCQHIEGSICEIGAEFVP